MLAALGVAVFFCLGVWQLHRAQEKRNLLSSFASGTERAIRISGELGTLARYQSVELSGKYDAEHQILLDNMPSSRGQPGYRVLTVLQRDAADWLLVDRGWVPAGRTRSQLPDLQVNDRVRIVRGQLDELPRPGIRLGTASEPDASGKPLAWPKVMNYPRLEELVAVLGHPLEPRILLLDPAQPEGYERVWQAHFGFGPERHLAYAVTWFALLATVLVTFVTLNFKKVVDDHGG